VGALHFSDVYQLKPASEAQWECAVKVGNDFKYLLLMV